MAKASVSISRRMVGFAAVFGLSLCMFACSPASEPTSNAVEDEPVADSVVLGDLERYSAEVGQSAGEGTSLSFDEESNLQQEKTAGFTGGAVTSQLEELPAGITGYAEDEPTGMYATTGEPSVNTHGDAYGDTCLNCHLENDPVVPQSHVSNGIIDEQCSTCHETADE